jgi:hypothetical protein
MFALVRHELIQNMDGISQRVFALILGAPSLAWLPRNYFAIQIIFD